MIFRLLTRNVSIIRDVVAECGVLADEALRFSREAGVAMNDGDLVLAHRLNSQAKGLNEAAQRIIAKVSGE